MGLCREKKIWNSFIKKLTDHVEAVRRCLHQILMKKGPRSFSLYRGVIDGELRFNGALIWNLTTKSSILSVSGTSPSNKEEKETVRAVFQRGCSSGNQSSKEDLCLRFHDFNQCDERRQQYEQIRPIFKQIWAASLKVYGKPQYDIKVE
jgi:hypothetical protein